MGATIMRRLLQAVPALFVVSVLVFAVVRLIPGDAAAVMAGPDASAEDIALVRERLGLDQPVYVQYWEWITAIFRGDFGVSLSTKRPVVVEILPRALATLQLTIAAMLVAVVVGVCLGVIAAYFSGRAADRVISAFGMLGVSMPSYWTGLMLVLLLSVTLRLLPTGGNILPGSWVMPVAVLALHQAAMITRLTRSSFIEILSQDYIRSARLKGVPERDVVVRHALPNGGVTMLTFTGVQLGHLLAGSVVVEVVFAWPGLGRLAVDALLVRDLPMVQIAVLFFAVAILLVNLITDLLYVVIDPRMGK